jgi:hypothetical protein
MAKWHPESGVNPPLNRTIVDRMSKGELLEVHRNDMGAFFDLFPNSRPKCAGIPGCPCGACCKARGRLQERGGRG